MKGKFDEVFTQSKEAIRSRLITQYCKVDSNTIEDVLYDFLEPFINSDDKTLEEYQDILLTAMIMDSKDHPIELLDLIESYSKQYPKIQELLNDAIQNLFDKQAFMKVHKKACESKDFDVGDYVEIWNYSDIFPYIQVEKFGYGVFYHEYDISMVPPNENIFNQINRSMVFEPYTDLENYDPHFYVKFVDAGNLEEKNLLYYFIKKKLL